MAKKRGPDNFISRLFTRHDSLRKVEGRRAREMAKTMREVKDRALGLIDRNMTTFREAGSYVDSAAALSRAKQTVAEIDSLMAQRADWATNQVLSMRQEAWTKGVSDIEFASQRLPTGIQAKMEGSFGQIFPEAGFSAIQHPVLGVAPDAMFNGVRAGTTQNMRNILLNAVVSGESVQDTGRAISDSLDISIAAGERIARTNVNAAYNEAQRAVYDANSDIIAGYAWEATLDDRTTQICFMLHGQFWPIGSKTPGPPAHWNCRSILVPVFKDPAVQEVLDATPRRARNYDKKGNPTNVLVKGSTTPEQWARRQPSDITLRITGSKLKNQLFRKGIIDFDDLVDPSLRVRTDQEIIKRAAGLHPGNKALQKQARALGVKRVPSPAAIHRADAALAKKQPWIRGEPLPAAAEPKVKVPPRKSYKDRGDSATYRADWNRWEKSLSEKERTAIGDWGTDKSGTVRRLRLREIGIKKGADIKKTMDAFHHALDRAPGRGGTVYRGVALRESEYRELIKIKELRFRSSASTSRREGIGQAFARRAERRGVVFELKTNSSIDLSGLESFKTGEAEQIISRGAEFRVTRIEFRPRTNLTYILGEEI